LVPECSNLIAYPDKLNYSAKNLTEYSESILRLVDSSWSIENVRSAYQWITFISNYVALPTISTKRVSENLTSKRPKKTGIRLNIWNFLVKNFLNFAPLILEKRNLGKWDLSPNTSQLIRETLKLSGSSIASTTINQDKHFKITRLNSDNSQELANSLLKRLSLMYEEPTQSQIWSKYLKTLG
jgi:hypothetical protein